MPPRQAASQSNELGGAARIAALLATLANGPFEDAIAAARAQTGLTHGSKIANDAAEFLARLVFALLRGTDVEGAISDAAGASYEELDLTEIRQRVEATRSLAIAAAAESLGLACPTPKALPTILMLLDRCGDDFEKALIENTMAGGDNAARGLALGMILGARAGKTGIPARWIGGLEAAPRVESFLERLT
jgi:ADP-ribosylglycohydrolase